GEHYLRIRFDLLGLPGSTIEDANEVHSHIHALGQCRKIIREHQLTPVIAGDTAGSAREVRDWNDPTKLSFVPPIADALYGLLVLATGVKVAETNTTRVVGLARKQDVPARSSMPESLFTT